MMEFPCISTGHAENYWLIVCPTSLILSYKAEYFYVCSIYKGVPVSKSEVVEYIANYRLIAMPSTPAKVFEFALFQKRYHETVHSHS